MNSEQIDALNRHVAEILEISYIEHAGLIYRDTFRPRLENIFTPATDIAQAMELLVGWQNKDVRYHFNISYSFNMTVVGEYGWSCEIRSHGKELACEFHSEMSIAICLAYCEAMGKPFEVTQ